MITKEPLVQGHLQTITLDEALRIKTLFSTTTLKYPYFQIFND